MPREPANKRVVVFGAPRTGSNWLLELLRAYLLGRYPRTTYLGEYFNVNLLDVPHRSVPNGPSSVAIRPPAARADCWIFDYQLVRRRIASVRAPFTGPATIEKKREESARRLRWLAGAGRVLFKIQPPDLAYNSDLLEFLRDECELICIERRNPVDQILSGCLSACSGVWVVHAPMAPPPPPERRQFRCEPSLLEHFASLEEEYRRIRALLKPRKVFVYEDLLKSKSPFSALEQLGYRDWSRYAGLYRPTLRQNPDRDYLKSFSNRDEVAAWVVRYAERVGRPDLS